MKKLLLLFVCIACIGFEGQSQNSSSISSLYLGNNAGFDGRSVLLDYRSFDHHSVDYRDFGTNNTTKIIDDNATAGTRFITDFQSGKVRGFKKEYILRYDAFNDQMEIKKPQNNIKLIDKRTINEVRFEDGSTYKIYSYYIGKKNLTGYLKESFKGAEVTLLKKEVIKYVFEKQAESGYHTTIPAKYQRGKDLYFIADHNGKTRSFRSKKSFLNLFPVKKKELEKFIKSNSIKFSDEVSLTTLVKYLDTI